MSYPEAPDHTGKAPKHHDAATKATHATDLRVAIKPDILQSEEAFLRYHNTGYIDESAYESHSKNLDWLSVEEHPIIIDRIKTDVGVIELRKSNEKLSYVKTDETGEIIRDAEYHALHLTDEEIEKKGLPKTDTSLIATTEGGKVVGLASNEWGADGIWVIKEYQRKGIGLRLLIELRKQFKPERRIGQMTDAGQALARAYYNYLKEGGEKSREAHTAEEYADSQINAYHQSQSKEPFTEFKQRGDKGYKKAHYSQAAVGIYFSPNKELVSKKYGKAGGVLIPVHLDMRKPLDLGEYDAMYFDGKKVSYGDVVTDNFKREMRGEKPLPEPDIILTGITRKAKNWLIEHGYDSVQGMKGEMWSAPEYAVFDASQIKTREQLIEEFNRRRTYG